MKKRILSLVLVIAMCFTVLATLAVADDSELFALRDTIELYTERAWSWQEAQFDAMTDEQGEVIANAYQAYLDKSDEIEELAYSTAADIVEASYTEDGYSALLNAETMADLYKWKLMRDIMEARVDIQLEGDEYAAWLENFTAFEQANDDEVTASKPNAALNGLGSYSAELETYFDELVIIWQSGVALTGEDADKLVVYGNKYLDEAGFDSDYNEESYFAYLKDDVVELMADGMVDTFRIGMEVACGERVRGDAIFDEIDDRTMKSAFLIAGEELTRYYINLITPIREELVKLDKSDILAEIAGASGTKVLNGSNETAYETMYNVMKDVSAYIMEQDFMAEAIEKLAELGYDTAKIDEYNDTMIETAKAAMAIVDENHGLELVHVDVYLGRALLDAELVDGDGTVYEMGDVIEVEAGGEYEIELSFSHNRYTFVGNTLERFHIAQFDVEVASGSGIEAVAGETIGVIEVDATNAQPGDEIVINLYRGYNDDDDADEMDAYRYVTTYTIKAAGETPVEPPVEEYVELYDVENTTADGTITIQGETSLDYVTVVILKNGETVYAVVYEKAEFEAGIVLNAPEGAEEGDVYTVVVGTEKAAASDEFEIVAADIPVIEYEVTLYDIADTTADGNILIKGETNLNYVTVVILKDGNTVYAVVYEKAEFEAGIELNVPDNAQVGDVYTVVVGTEKAAASDEFEIVEEAAEYEVVLEEINDITADGALVIRGTTNLNYVTVAIVKDGNTIYAVVYTREELEAGIMLNAPDNAQVGDVYTVVVGTEKASASADFEIIEEPSEYEVVLDEIADITVDGTLVIKGTTNLDYVTVAIVKDGETVYAVVYTKAEFEAGIELNAPAGAEVGDVYTVVVGTEKASASADFEIIEEPSEYEVVLEGIEDVTVDGVITVKGETNLDYVTVAIVKDGETVYAVVYTKAELEAGIQINAPAGAEVGDVYTVVVGTEKASASTEFAIIESTPAEEPTLALTGSDKRSVAKGGTRDITTTPQNVPEGAVAEVVWTVEDDEIIEVTAVSGDNNRNAKVKGLKKGTTTLTATLYVDGVAVDFKTITVTVTTGGTTTGGKIYTTITVPVDENKAVVSASSSAATVEFVPSSGNGAVEVAIVDGEIVVTGVTAGTVKGAVVIKNANGAVISTLYYEFVVTDKEVVVDEHECQWPDIAATETTDAHWAHLTIDTMTINGYISGYPDGLFRPDQNITRAEFSAIVYRILGLQVAEDGVIYDDTAEHWAVDLIATMSLPEGYGMLRGYGDGNFGPDDYITREQAVAIIARAKSAVWEAAEEGAKDVFTDSENISWWFDGEMDAAVTNGLITGYEDGSYRPLNFTTRAEACTLLARAWPEILE